MNARHRLSKSKFMIGLQCPKRLWWTVHDANAPELTPDAERLWLFEHGSKVGEVARAHSGPGTLVQTSVFNLDLQVAKTQVLMASGTERIFEAAFSAEGVFVSVDVLERMPTGNWRVVEVKSSTKVKPEHLDDLAVQVHVVESSGFVVDEAVLMHLNREHRYPDVGPLFLREDVTDDVRNRVGAARPWIRQHQAVLVGGLPKTTAGPQCKHPYPCPFIERCRPAVPPHHVSNLYSIRQPKLQRLLDAGYETIDEIGLGTKLSNVQARQHRAVCTGDVVVEPGLAKALEFEGPVAFLDFETIGIPLPVWEGTRPWEQVPVQFSVWSERSEGDVLVHREFLSAGRTDPRRELAEALLEATASDATVLAWNAHFEVRCISGLTQVFPDLASDLNSLAARVEDLLKVTRDHVYDPEFHGSFSIKRVLPALCPGNGWGDGVADGRTAAIMLEHMLLHGRAPPGKSLPELRRELREYCKQDTLAMVGILRRLRELAGSTGQS